MKYYSKEETIKRHRKMWSWMADKVESWNIRNSRFNELWFFKEYAIKKLYPEDVNELEENCYLCDYAQHQKDLNRGCMGMKCHFCPLGHQETLLPSNCLNFLYYIADDKFENLNCDSCKSEFVAISREIADLPERNFSDDRAPGGGESVKGENHV